MSDPEVLLVLAALALCAPFIALAYWLIVDARDRAEMKRHQAAMAALGARIHRENQDRGRYLADDPQRPE